MSFGHPLLIASVGSMLGVRPGMTVGVAAPPPGFLERLLPLPEGACLLESSKTGLDLCIAFAQRKVEVVERLATWVPRLSVTGGLWLFFAASASEPSLANEEFVRLAALEMGLVDVKRADLDPAWVALRFGFKSRPPRPELPRATA